MGRRRRIVLKPDPLGVQRNPLAIYLLVLAWGAGVLTLAGQPAARSISNQFGPITQAVWGLLLVLGSTSTLVGIYWQGNITTGLLLKRVGMLVLAVASGVHGLVSLVTYGLSAVSTSGITLGLCGACALQYRALNQRVRAILLETQAPGTVVVPDE